MVAMQQITYNETYAVGVSILQINLRFEAAEHQLWSQLQGKINLAAEWVAFQKSASSWGRAH